MRKEKYCHATHCYSEVPRRGAGLKGGAYKRETDMCAYTLRYVIAVLAHSSAHIVFLMHDSRRTRSSSCARTNEDNLVLRTESCTNEGHRPLSY